MTDPKSKLPPGIETLPPSQQRAAAERLVEMANAVFAKLGDNPVARKRPTRRGRKPKHPVPAYWSDETAKTYGHLANPAERHAAADELEKTAQELRGMKTKGPARTEQVTLLLLPVEAELLREYAKRRGAKDSNADVQLGCGARWTLENALRQFERTEEEGDRLARYRDAEGFAHDTLQEMEVVRALAAYRKRIKEEADEADED